MGAGYRKKGLTVTKNLSGCQKFLSATGGSKLDNEINFRFDLKVTDNVTVNNQIGAGYFFANIGQQANNISPYD
ncbi:MAG: hypothetical protein WDM71_04570 [Ferruginibacter sp.]